MAERGGDGVSVVRSSTALVFSAALPANTVNAAPFAASANETPLRIGALDDWPKPAGGIAGIFRAASMGLPDCTSGRLTKLE